MKILRVPASTLRAGAVLAPEFIARNALRDQLSAQGWAVTGGTPEQFGAFARAEQERWATVVKTANVRVE